MPPAPRPVVMKFGGTSVEDAAALARVARIVSAQAARTPVIVVTSAMRGATDALLAAVRAARPVSAVTDVLERHRAAATELLPADAALRVERLIATANERIPALLSVIAEHPGTRRPLQDEIVSHGERLASALLVEVLEAAGTRAAWVDGRACIRTDGEHSRAAPLRAATDDATRASLRPALEGGVTPVLGGFIGSADDGSTTTLGRGGSDFTAALVGAAVDAAEVQIWTDVSGFMTADPRVVDGARSIPRLHFAEAAELAYFGARVLHPRTIQPAVERAIPVRICNSRDALAPSTLIDDRAERTATGVKAIAHKTGVTVVQVTSARMLGAHGFLRAIFEAFDRHRIPVDLVATSEVSVSMTVEDTERLDEVVRDLRAVGEVAVESAHAIVCVVGEGLRGTSGIAARVFGTIEDINVSLISQGASALNLSFVVREGAAADAVRRLHEHFFSPR